jgi:flagellar biosynthesis/type III secretory pathway chaperone
MSISKQLNVVDESINALQRLQCTHLEMHQLTDKCISETISRLLKEKQHLQYKLIQKGNIRTKYLNYMKALFN